jgi:uracil-DNA glycosylase
MAYQYDMITARIHEGWNGFFTAEIKKEIESTLESINKDISETIDVFPYPKDVFRSLFYFGPSDIKLVILGQDPYIGYEMIDNVKVPQAHGLSFSVPKSHKKIPPSLKNIYKEIGISPNNGSLLKWVKNEKILLLNSALTVLEGKSNSHMMLWNNITDEMIRFISKENPGTIFLLMGCYAISKSNLIDKKHTIFKTVHPSPLSAHRGFFGCNVFNKINDFLVSKGMMEIKWS